MTPVNYTWLVETRSRPLRTTQSTYGTRTSTVLEQPLSLYTFVFLIHHLLPRSREDLCDLYWRVSRSGNFLLFLKRSVFFSSEDPFFRLTCTVDRSMGGSLSDLTGLFWKISCIHFRVSTSLVRSSHYPRCFKTFNLSSTCSPLTESSEFCRVGIRSSPLLTLDRKAVVF